MAIDNFTPGQILDAVTLNNLVTEINNNSSEVETSKKVKFIKLGIPGDQHVSTGSQINFDTIRSSYGITKNGNGVNVQAGRTYKIQCGLNCINPAGNAYIGYRIFTDNMGFIGEECYSQGPVSNAAHIMKTSIHEYYTPVADDIIRVQVMDDNIGTGFITPAWNTFLSVEEIGRL